MEGKTAKRTRGGSRRRRAAARWKDRLSFGATLVAVAATAIFVGWLLGQYAIQAVTGPRLVSEPLERPAVGAGVPTAASGGAATEPAEMTTSGSAADAGSAAQATGDPAGVLSSGGTPATPPTPSSTSGGLWRVQAGAFSDRSRADAVVDELHAQGFEAVVAVGAPPVPYRVQVGAFREEARARSLVEQLRAAGFEAALFAPDGP